MNGYLLKGRPIQVGSDKATKTPRNPYCFRTLEFSPMKRRILLVDDELAILLTLKAVLEMNDRTRSGSGSKAGFV